MRRRAILVAARLVSSTTTSTGDPLTALDVSMTFGGTPIDGSFSFIIVGFQ